ncbi:MAG: LbtU family siderophore porin [Pseudomonadota bacterium]
MSFVNYCAAASLATCIINTTHAVVINDQLEITGTIEVEAAYHSADNQSNTTDLTVATGELGIGAQINDWTSASLLVLFEDGGKGDDTFEVDEASVHFANPADSPYSVSVGRQYVPFGHYDTAFVQDPLTLTLAETRATALTVGLEQDHLHASAYLFNGNVDNMDNRIGHYGLRLETQQTWQDTALTVGLSYTNSIAESGGLEKASTNEKVAGFSINAHMQLDDIALHGEYIAAQDNLAGANSQAVAYHTEISQDMQFGNTPGAIGFTWQRTKEADAFGLAEQRIGAVIRADLMENVGLALEMGNEKDYAGNSSQYAVAQLAVTF